MWLITNFGFFSVVEKPDDKKTGTLTIRARAEADLLALRQRYLPELGEILAHAGTDYRYRAKASRNAVANAMARAVFDIDYSNFKNSVAKQQGHERADVYSEVWSVLFRLEEKAAATSDLEDSPRCAKGCSYGGVLVDDQGRILLREPTGHFDGYVWTFPKGRGKKTESQIAVALREVLEETGYPARVIQRIPQVFQGGMGDNVYFLMRPAGDPRHFDPSETKSICWAKPKEARQLISRTTNAVGRERDLAVLEAAIATLGGRASV